MLSVKKYNEKRNAKLTALGKAVYEKGSKIKSRLRPLLLSKVKGAKHDLGKRQWALIPWRELGKVCDVLTQGAVKYSPDNWKHVPDAETRYFEAAIRHITLRRQGKINDKGFGLPHLAHAICCLLFWMWFDHQKKRGHR